jgi:hypothetical protein
MVNGERLPERGGSPLHIPGLWPYVLRHLGPQGDHRLTEIRIGSRYR